MQRLAVATSPPRMELPLAEEHFPEVMALSASAGATGSPPQGPTALRGWAQASWARRCA